MADTAELEVKAGPVMDSTITVKLLVTLLPVRELIALKTSVKVPLMPEAGANMITPVAELREAQGGREVTVNEFAPLLLRI